MEFVLALAVMVAVAVAVGTVVKRLRVADRRALAVEATRRSLVAAREREGGTPQRPVDIPSPAVVEARAAQVSCPACEQGMMLEQHTAEMTEAGPRRVANLQCRHCGLRWPMYFRLVVGDGEG